MTVVRFSPSSWQSGGRALTSSAESWQSQVSGNLSRIAQPIEGADTGMTLADTAVATICPVVAGVLEEMVQTIAEALSITGENMVATGRLYEATEGDNVLLAESIAQDL